MAIERWEAYMVPVLEALNANGAEIRRRGSRALKTALGGR